MKYRPLKKERIDPIDYPCKKEVYYTPEDAQMMISHIEETRVTRNLKAYRCNVCGFWHLTSRGKEL
ncbi:MAG: hypothetical protein RBS37_13745 [Bacteroidales bacterium]|jgi:hypothetical protein|nr:hypothetical protein [Bacteroidales bacterium]